MLRNISFSLDFCYFKDISDKVTANDDVIVHNDVTCMMTSSLIYRVFQKSWAHFDNEYLGNY